VPPIDRSLNRHARAELCAALLACLAFVNGVRAQAEPAPVEPSTPAVGSDTAPAPSAKPADPPPSAAAPTAPAEPPAPPPPPPPPPPPLGPPPAPGSFAEKVVYEPPKDDVTTLTASGGGALNGGNTNSYAVNVGANFQLIRQPHGFTAFAAFAYGVADLPGGGDNLEPIVRNLNAKARYDFFMSRLDALFLATVFRWDPFAGIDRRNQGQIGYLRYFLREDKHRFWGEIGYDLTSDNLGPVEGVPDAALPADESVIVHSARLFAGYDNQLNASLTYLGGLEALFNVEESKDVRLNFSNALRSAIAGDFSLELKLTLAFDNVPATTDAKKLDTTLLVNVIYQLL
jgi:putative salt-induced outer membrane protein YdiY